MSSEASGAPDFRLNMLDSQMSLNLSLAVAAVVAKAVLKVGSGILVTGVNGGGKPFVNGAHRHHPSRSASRAPV